jgi:spermidine synthase
LDPRVHIQFNDGRNYLLATDKMYDLILSEPSNPWQAGVCNLFTREYFQICQRRLKPGGMFTLWMQTAEVPTADLAAVLASLKQTFPHTTAFEPLDGNLIVLASMTPIVINLHQVQELFETKKIAGAWRGMGVRSPESFLGRLVVADDGMQKLNSKYLNTDDHNRLEFDVGKSYEAKEFFMKNLNMLAGLRGNPWRQIDWGALSPTEKAGIMDAIGKEALNLSHPDVSLGWAQAANEAHENASAYRLEAASLGTKGEMKLALEKVNHSLSLEPQDIKTLWTRGMIYQQMGQKVAARQDFDKLLEIEPENPTAKVLTASGYLADMPRQTLAPDQMAAGDFRATKIIALLTDLANGPFVQVEPDVLWAVAEAHFRLGHFKEAEKYAAHYFTLVPRDAEKYAAPIMRLMHKAAQHELTVHTEQKAVPDRLEIAK